MSNKELREFTEKHADEFFESKEVKLYAMTLLTTIEAIEEGDISYKTILEVIKASLKSVVEGTFVSIVEDFKKENPYPG